MRVLMIGQLPKEAGGNYTTGAAKVVYELSKQKVGGLDLFTFATNTPEQAVKPYCTFPNQYIGYRKAVWAILKDFVLKPLRTLKEWNHFRRVDHESPLRFTFYKTNIQRAIEIVQPDVIHVHSISNVSATRFAIGDRQIPILLTCHGIFYRGDKNDSKGYDKYMGNLPLCEYYTGLTEEARHEFTDILGIQPAKYTIIPNGVDSSKFYYSAEWRQKIRYEQKVSDDTIVFITVASLQERKGQLAFIKILEQLDIHYQYWLVGTGPDKERIENYISEYHLDGIVKLLGYHDSDDLYRYYSAADVYAHPSWKEGQALSEIEAFATGLRAIVNKAIKGTLVDDPNNHEQYCIVDFDNIQHDVINDWIRETERKRVSRSNYDWKYIMERYADVYRKMLN